MFFKNIFVSSFQRSESDNRSDQNSRDRSRSASRATFLSGKISAFFSSKWVKQTAQFAFFSDDEDNDSKAVTMKDDILTAVTDFNPKPGMSINKSSISRNF